MNVYKYPTPEAVRTINEVFDLPAHGQEQDWGIELAVLAEKNLDVECRSALALLVLFSFTYPEPAIVTTDLVALARWTINSDSEIHQRMLSFGSDGFGDHEEWVRKILI